MRSLTQTVTLMLIFPPPSLSFVFLLCIMPVVNPETVVSTKSPDTPTKKKKRGRHPKGDKAFEFTLQVRLSDEQHKTYQNLGGYEWLRHVLNVAAQTPEEVSLEREDEPLFIRALPSTQTPMTIPEVAIQALGTDKKAKRGSALKAAGAQFDPVSLLTPSPERSFFYQMPDDRLLDLGIAKGDMLVVKQGLRPRTGDIVLMVDIDATKPTFHVGKLLITEGEHFLCSENAKNPSPTLLFSDFQKCLFGVVVSSVKHFRKF